MAANNYFGFTTGGTQYGTAPAAAAAATYQATQAAAAAAAAGYAVQHATQPYATATPRASQAAYETYQAAGHTTTTYPYASRQQAYEKAQTYYPQPTQVAYSTTETAHYQSVTKPSYTASTPAYTSPRPTAGQKTQGPSNPTGSSSSYMFSSGAGSNTSGSYTSTYNAPATTNYTASMYVQQTSMGGQSGSTGAAAASVATNATQAASAGAAVGANKVGAATWASFRKGPMKPQKPKQPPKPQQLHYCEVCKISCAGPQTYREHLEGQKHKKKEAAMKAGTSNQNVRGGTSLRCELCDVTCTGSDAYAAHIRGSKHQKVVKLHTKLGKPIPSTDPVVISNATNSPVSSTTTGTTSTAKASSTGSTPSGKTATNSSTSADANKKIIGAPKINFVGGTKLSTTTKEEPKTDEEEAIKDDALKMDDKPDVQPVGQDYIEEIKNDEGKVISFQCKLCECRFNDPNAKEMHMKGRRHRLQYKRKVNPDLVVDIKPSLRQRKIQEERLRRQQMREDYWKRREEERWREEMRMMEEEERMYWEERRRYEEEMEYYEYYRRYGRDPRMMPPPPPMPPRSFPPPLMPPMGPAGVMGGAAGKRPESSDDKHVLAKHTHIYPKEEELATVQKIVTNTEKALKLVSDFLAESDAPPPQKNVAKEEESGTKKEAAAGVKKEPLIAKEPLIKEPLLPREGADANSEHNADKSEEENLGNQPQRALKGVMRVGVLAKGLLLTGDQAVQLVVMCSEKPTRTLLDRVADNLPKQLATVAPDEKYEVKRCVEEAALVVSGLAEPKMSVTITLTSPVMRESGDDTSSSAPLASANPSSGAAAPVENTIKDPPDVLDRQKCLEALAALRHAKWFQARASGLPSCVMIIRILRDLCQRVPTWGRLNSWATELLVEKVISSTGQSLSPGDALRRVLEAIAFGILLPGGPGLMDPCEKDPTDAAGGLTNQEREDITASAQHALRLIAFRQIHKVLGMDPLPPPKFTRNQFSRKRRRDASAGEGNDSEGADGKKDKKDDSESKPEGMETGESQPAAAAGKA